ncbi:3-mercaptopyruvate sulfurtransferase [Edaphovirga cremea]|uniref:3-mercaptopyruvate sulfurtransferase n=1 Tax=Edaphovirga cremea TaxID=2267246 RepID=UPI000DEF3B15|nr:3-mercaptopyruvate sulfurtransferase [Edaphovirga cremea]
MKSPFIVSAHWLADHLTDNSLIVVDCRMPKPGTSSVPNMKAEYLAGHIPGAVYLDIDGTSDTSTPLPHMMPTDASFSKTMGNLGISNKHTVVLYDEGDLFSAPRAWWMLLRVGLPEVQIRVLDGGINAWHELGLAVESGEKTRAPEKFSAKLAAGAIKTQKDVMNVVQNGGTQILDARAAGRFKGEVAEPRPGLHSGHIPGSINVPFTEISENGHLKPLDGLKKTFAEHGVDIRLPIIVSCGSGVTAAALAFALHSVGAPTVGLYDGAWTEWGDVNKQWPVAKG